MKQGIEWVILMTDNYPASLNFYQHTLGFKIEREFADEEFCQFSLDNCKFVIYGRHQLAKLVPADLITSAGGAIYSFPESIDIDADVLALKAKGVTFIVEPETRPWGQRTAYFTDPDGHIWELQQWVQGEQ